MAFNAPQTFALITQPIGIQGIQIWSYQTDDPISEVMVAGYFTDVATWGAHIGDMILCVASDGTNSFAVSLTSIDVAGDGTAEHVEDFPLATQEEAEEGTGNVSVMTPLRTAQAIDAQVPEIITENLHYRSIYDFANGATIGDGATDASAALQEGLEWCMVNGGMLYLPAGRYLCDSPVVLSSYSATDEANPRTFGIRGDGRRTSVIVVSGTNTVGGIDISFSGSANRHFVSTFSDFGIVVESGTKTGPIFRVARSGTGVGNARHVTMRSVDIWQAVDDNPATTDRVVDLRGTAHVLVFDCIFMGNNNDTDATDDWIDSGFTFATPRILDLDGAYSPEVINCHLRNGATLLSNVGSGSEQLVLLNSLLVGCKTGLRWLRASGSGVAVTGISKTNPGVVTAPSHGVATGDRFFLSNVLGMKEASDREYRAGVVAGDNIPLLNPLDGTNVDTTTYTTWTSGGTVTRVGSTLQQPNLFVEHNHIHARDAGLDLRGLKRSHIHNNDFALSATPTLGTGFGVWLKNSEGVTIDHNNFQSGQTTTTDIFVDALDNDGKGDFVHINRNRHSTGGISAIRISTVASNWRVDDPIISIAGSYTTPLDLPVTGPGLTTYQPPAENQQWVFEGNLATAVRGPKYILYRNSSSPANNDRLAALEFHGNDSAPATNEISYGAVEGWIEDTHDTNDTISPNPNAGGLILYGRTANTEVARMRIGGADGITMIPVAATTPNANGELTIEATSNTTLTFKLKGSDGTVRSGTVTLA